MLGTKATYEPVVESGENECHARDQELLLRLGKKPVLKRNFGFVTILGFTSTITVLWESVLLLMDTSIQNGGPQSFIYGFIVVWVGCLALFACLSELASMAPTAGGQYHWVGMMSPPGCQRFLSFVEGWMAVLGWQGASVGRALLSSRIILGLAKLCHPDYETATWHYSVLSIGLVGFAMLINISGGNLLPRFEGMVLALHLIGFCAVLVPLLTLGQQLDASDVFDVFNNGGNLPTEGLAFFMGLQGLMYAFIGGDGAIHMSEEIQNAPIIVPRGIMINYLVNGAMAFGISIAALYSRGTLDDLLNPMGGFAIIEIIHHNVKSVPGAAIMVSTIATLQISAGVSNYACATRILWGFARDKGIPGWKKLQEVDERTTVPFYACLLTALISAAFSLLPLGSITAFDTVISVAVAGLYGSYLVACGMLLHRRCTGVITPYNPHDKDPVNTVGVRLAWGPWRMPGAIGIIINVFAVVYLSCAFLFVFWPIEFPLTLQNMNWTSAIFGGSMLIAIAYYFLWGNRDWYGPVVETSTGKISRHSQHPSQRMSEGTMLRKERTSPATVAKSMGQLTKTTSPLSKTTSPLSKTTSPLSAKRTTSSSEADSDAATAVEDTNSWQAAGTFGRPSSIVQTTTAEAVAQPEPVHPDPKDHKPFHPEPEHEGPGHMVPAYMESVHPRHPSARSPRHGYSRSAGHVPDLTGGRYSSEPSRSARIGGEQRNSGDWFSGDERSRTMDDKMIDPQLAAMAVGQASTTVRGTMARARSVEIPPSPGRRGSSETKSKAGVEGSSFSFATFGAKRAPTNSGSESKWNWTDTPDPASVEQIEDLSTETQMLSQPLTGTGQAMKEGPLGLLAKGI